ncbi:MAG: ubiquinone biosynthesis protein UbiB, partial [Novosphingobium sp.]
IADRIKADAETLLRLPDLIRRIEDRFPAKGGAPEPPPLPEVPLVWERRAGRARWPGYALALVVGGAAVWGAVARGWIG